MTPLSFAAWPCLALVRRIAANKALHVSGALKTREQVFKLCEWKWLPQILRRVVDRSRVEGGGGYRTVMVDVREEQRALPQAAAALRHLGLASGILSMARTDQSARCSRPS